MVMSMGPRWERHQVLSILSCLAYSSCSISMILANKLVLGEDFYSFGHPTLTIVIQNVIALLVLRLAKALGYVNYEGFDRTLAVRWIPVNLYFIAMLVSSALSIRYLPIHMITVFKNITNIGISWGEWFFFRQSISSGVIGSLCLMLFGAVMGALSDLTFILVGYFWMVLNCLATAAYVLYMRHVTGGNTIKLSRFGMVYYNNLISVPLCLILAAVLGELGTVWKYPYLLEPNFWIAIIFSGVVGVALNFASYWCVGSTTATTYATVGAINKIPGILIGYFFMGQYIDMRTGFYVSFGMLGALLYSYAKLKEAQTGKGKKGYRPVSARDRLHDNDSRSRDDPNGMMSKV